LTFLFVTFSLQREYQEKRLQTRSDHVNWNDLGRSLVSRKKLLRAQTSAVIKGLLSNLSRNRSKKGALTRNARVGLNFNMMLLLQIALQAQFSDSYFNFAFDPWFSEIHFFTLFTVRRSSLA